MQHTVPDKYDAFPPTTNTDRPTHEPVADTLGLSSELSMARRCNQADGGSRRVMPDTGR